MPEVKTAVFFGGEHVDKNKATLQTVKPVRKFLKLNTKTRRKKRRKEPHSSPSILFQHIVVGTPGRILDLVNQKLLKLDNLKHFVLDECDRILAGDSERDLSLFPSVLLFLNQYSFHFLSSSLFFLLFFFPACCCAEMRKDVQEILLHTPHQKQVMMFSATLPQTIRPICKKFMQDVRQHQQPFTAPLCIASPCRLSASAVAVVSSTCFFCCC